MRQQEPFRQYNADCRPRIRWWLPGADLETTELIRELENMKQAGIGGVELSFLGQNGPGWGSEMWFAHLATILREATRLGLQVDLMPGVHWVTSAVGIQLAGAASEKELVILEETISCNQMTTLRIPAPKPRLPGAGNHDFDSRAAVTDAMLVGVTARKANDDGPAVVLMEPDELGTDLQNAAVPDTFAWTPPEPGSWVISAFWAMPTGILIRGVPAIDHFSQAGSHAVTAYWDKQLTKHPKICAALRNCGKYLFLDSLELGTKQYWTLKLPREFQKRRGYALLPWLHCVYADGGNYTAEKVRRDFSQTLTELLGINYFQELSTWCGHYGLELRAQSCYGIWAEMAQASMYIDCPETERLGFTDSLDGYRGQAGAVHIQGKPVYSAELAPVLGAAWRQTWKQMLFHTYRCFAAGVNQVVWHGYAYRTDREDMGEQWPGYSPMAPLFSEELGTRVPSWRFVRPVNDAITRQQWFLRQGHAVVDLAIYRHSDWEDNLRPDYLEDDLLDQMGYAYDFISPAHFLSERELVKDGRLFPKGPNYKALLFINQTHLPVKFSRILLTCAQAGLPILFIGEIPTGSSYFLPKGGDAEVRENMTALLCYKNTASVLNMVQGVAWLREQRLLPDARPEIPTALLTAHRQTEHADLYYFLRQRKQAGFQKTSQPDEPLLTKVFLQGTGNVYRLDPWTDTVYQIKSQSDHAHIIEFELELAGNDAALILVTNHEIPAKPYPGACQKRLLLERWDIVLSVWQPSETDHLETVVTDLKFLSRRLEGWEQLAGKPVSGTARYCTEFLLPACSRCVLTLGQVVDICCVTVNGRPAPAVNPVTSAVDISRLVWPGKNTLEVEVEVGSNLYGAMRSLGRTFEDLIGKDAPKMPGLQATEFPCEAGLLGPVTLEYTPWI